MSTFRAAVPSDFKLGAVMYLSMGSVSGESEGRLWFVPATIACVQVAAVSPSRKTVKLRTWVPYNPNRVPAKPGHWSATLPGGNRGWYRLTDWRCRTLVVEVTP